MFAAKYGVPVRVRSEGSSGVGWLALLVVLIAAACRIVALGSVPRWVHPDEANTALTAAETVHHGLFEISNGPAQQTYFAYFLPSAGIFVFGYNLFGARIGTALMGVLTVWLVFDGVRRAIDVRTAAVAGVLLAVAHCHVHHSRLAMPDNTPALVVALIFWLLVRLWQRPNTAKSIALGVVAAVGMQTWVAALLIGPLFVLSVGLLVLGSAPGFRRGLVLAVVAFGLSAMPFLFNYWRVHGTMSSRTQMLFILNPERLAQYGQYYGTDSAVGVVARRVWAGISAFHLGRSYEGTYDTTFPMADWITAWLMLPGLIFLVASCPAVVSVPTLVFTVGHLIVGLGLFPPTGFDRATGALPLAMIPPALALTKPLEWMSRTRGWLRVACDLSLVPLLACVGYVNGRLYLVDYKDSITRWASTSEAAWTAREYANTYRTHLVSWSDSGNEDLKLILGGLPAEMRKVETGAAYVQSVVHGPRDLFILDASDTDALDAVRSRFPQARFEVLRRETNNEPMLILAFVEDP